MLERRQSQVVLTQVVSRQTGELGIGFWAVARSVLIFLGAPLVAGVILRYGTLPILPATRLLPDLFSNLRFVFCRPFTANYSKLPFVPASKMPEDDFTKFKFDATQDHHLLQGQCAMRGASASALVQYSKAVLHVFAGLIAIKGRKWLDEKFMLYFGPLALVALVYTIIILFALQVGLA